MRHFPSVSVHLGFCAHAFGSKLCVFLDELQRELPARGRGREDRAFTMPEVTTEMMAR